MKKLDLSNIVEGVRKLGAVKAVFEQMQDAMVEGFASILMGLTSQSSGAVAMYGVIDSGGGAPNYNISAGWIYYQGELYEVPAFSGVAGGGQVPVLSLNITQRAEDPLVYSDGNNFDTLDVRKLTWAFAASGSGIADYSDLLRLANLINTLIDVPGQIAAVVDSAPGALDTLNELAAALGDDANFASTVTTALAGKLSNSAGAVGNSNLATDAVSTAKIQANAITSTKVNSTVAKSNGAIGGLDANSITDPGIYTCLTNGPTGDSCLLIAVAGAIGSSINAASQIAIMLSGAGVGDIYYRGWGALGPWGSWTLINDASA